MSKVIDLGDQPKLKFTPEVVKPSVDPEGNIFNNKFILGRQVLVYDELTKNYIKIGFVPTVDFILERVYPKVLDLNISEDFDYDYSIVTYAEEDFSFKKYFYKKTAETIN